MRSLVAKNIENKQINDKRTFGGKHLHAEYEEVNQVKVIKVDRSEKPILRWFAIYYLNKKLSEVNCEVFLFKLYSFCKLKIFF